MLITISIDTMTEKISDSDKELLLAIAGAAPTAAAAKPAAAKPAAAKPAAAKPAKPAKPADVEQELDEALETAIAKDEDPTPSQVERAASKPLPKIQAAPDLKAAVQRATLLVSEGKGAAVKAALTAVGAGRVSALEGEQIELFMAHVADA